MSRKANRLKNRLRIEKERADKRLRELADRECLVSLNEHRLQREQQTLNRSLALRMRVNRDFERPYGEMWALNIVLWPREFMIDFRGGDRFQNASYYSEMKGREAGKQIAQVIERCIAGELAEFEKAR